MWNKITNILHVLEGIIVLVTWLMYWVTILERHSLRSLRRSFLEFKRHYGSLRAILLVFIFPDVRHGLDRIQRDILDPPVDDSLAAVRALMLRESISNRCATLSNTASAMVQLPMLTLSLPVLRPVPWVALVALVFSLTTGILSLFLAIILQRHVDNLLEPSDVKTWFGRPAEKQGIAGEADTLFREDSTHSLKHEKGGEETGCTKRLDREQAMRSRWKNVSFHAAFMMRIPGVLSVWSSGAFLIGLGVYLISYWASNGNLETPAPGTADDFLDRYSSLVVVVAYIVAMALGLLLVLVPSVLKYIQDAPLRQLDEATNLREGRSKLDFESRFGDFEEYFKDSGELFEDFKECCRNFQETFGYFDKLYAEVEDIFWGSVGEPRSSGTLADEYSDILLDDSAELSGNTPAHENTQTQESCQEESRQRNDIAEEATQLDVEEDSDVGSGSSSPEEGFVESQGQPTLKQMKRRMELMRSAEERNIVRLRLMLLKVKLNKYDLSAVSA